MKKVAFGAIAVALIFSSHANAQTRDPNNVGCGLGSMAFNKQPGIYQIMAATTNSLTGTQTFGITTGTSAPDRARILHSRLPHWAERFVLSTPANLGGAPPHP